MSWMASYRHGTRANCGTKGDAAATGKATGEEEYTAYVPVFSWDRNQVSLVGLVRGTSSRPPQEHEGQGLFLPDTCKVLNTQKHLQANKTVTAAVGTSRGSTHRTSVHQRSGRLTITTPTTDGLHTGR